MSDADTYAVDLTFDEWMKVCVALSESTKTNHAKGLDGEANRMNNIHGKIVDGLKDD